MRSSEYFKLSEQERLEYVHKCQRETPEEKRLRHRENFRRWREENKEKEKVRLKKYYNENKERLLAKRKQYSKKAKERSEQQQVLEL